MPQTIALVDDDRNILTSVADALEAEGFMCAFYRRREALKGLTAQPRPRDPRHQDAADGRPGAARRLRKHGDLPVIFLTSKDEEIDEVLGLRMGADDYIRKPFSQRLLIERIRAAAAPRRASASARRREPARPRRASSAAICCSTPRAISAPGRAGGRSTVTEFLLLKALAHRPGHVKNRDQLMDAAYGETSMSMTAPSTATSSGCARSSNRSMSSSTRSRLFTASATATGSADLGRASA